jgi:preprotein translocase subunit YajC
MTNAWIVAQADGNQGVSRISAEPVGAGGQSTAKVQDKNAPAPAQPEAKSAWAFQLVMLLVMFALMYFVLFRGPKKKQQEHKKMLDSLEKNDRVCTIGGIIGTVMEVRNDEVILKVDDSNNTKLHVRTSAIAANLAKENPNP